MATKDLDKVVLTNLVKENTAALTKQTEILNRINDQLKSTITQYGSFDKSITELKTYMKALIGIGSGIFVSFLAALVIYVLK